MPQYVINNRDCIFTISCFKELQNCVSDILTIIRNVNNLQWIHFTITLLFVFLWCMNMQEKFWHIPPINWLFLQFFEVPVKLKSPVGTSSSSVTNNAVSPTKTQQTTVIQVSTALSEHYVPESVILLMIDVSLLLSYLAFH
jgi:hypothetical protein